MAGIQAYAYPLGMRHAVVNRLKFLKTPSDFRPLSRHGFQKHCNTLLSCNRLIQTGNDILYSFLRSDSCVASRMEYNILHAKGVHPGDILLNHHTCKLIHLLFRAGKVHGVRRMSQKGAEAVFLSYFLKFIYFLIAVGSIARASGIAAENLHGICLHPHHIFRRPGNPVRNRHMCPDYHSPSSSTGRHASPNLISLKSDARPVICFRRRISSLSMPRCLDIQASDRPSS